MYMFVVSLIIIASLFIMGFQTLKNYKYKELADSRAKAVPWLMGIDVLLFAADMAAGGEVCGRMVADLVLSLSVMLTLLSSVWKPKTAAKIVKVLAGVQLVLVLIYIMCALKVIPLPGDRFVLSLTVVLSIVLSSLFLYSLWSRIREVKSVMKSGTVWANLCLSVDSIYLVSIQMSVFLFIFVSCLVGSLDGMHACLAVLLLGSSLAASGLRVVFDSAFVLLHKHERRIVESMKISHVEIASTVDSKLDEMYRDVYERVVVLFEMKKPFLNSDLTINDIVKVVFTNKVYISRAISHYTGRNFCQFVNYHRVIYSMETFRKNPEMKVAELATTSGFNSVVSFSMAFRLFMNENPSDWCRKERLRLLKTKK